MEKLTTQGLLAQHLKGIFSRHKFPLYQYKALSRLSVCRTKTLGGHSQYCEAGHLNGVWYNSCKHRSCPQCRGMVKEQWLRNTQKFLLDCPHHHVIFTLPEELNAFWRFNRELMTNLLFQAVRDTLKEFADDPKHLGATLGLMMVLHTWGRSLSLHPHIHCLISHGGINSEGDWVEPKRKILFPQKPVMMVYRGKFRALMGKALEKGDVVIPSDKREQHIKTLLNKLGRKEWVVHFCDRYEHGTGVAKYLARYVTGSPFKNSQLSMKGDLVHFRYQSHQTKKQETLRLNVDDFVKRMVQHVLTPGKPNVRYGGLYAPASRVRLNVARSSLGQTPVTEREVLEWQQYLEGIEHQPVCKECGLPLYHREEVPHDRQAA